MRTKRSNRLFLLPLLALLFLFCGRTTAAMANAPVPMYFFTLTVENPPEGSCGVDFLIPRDQIPAEEYTDCNREALEAAGLPEGCGLQVLDDDGFVSFMLHDTEGRFEGALMAVDEASAGGQAAHMVTAGYEAGYMKLTKSGSPTTVKLALFDGEGRVLKVSVPFEVRRSTPWVYYGNVRFDAATGEACTVMPDKESLEAEADHNRIFLVVAALFVLGLTALVTCLIEFIIALLFRLKPAPWVLLVNLLSNLVFNILLIILCFARKDPVPYGVFIPVGELVVTAAEYLIYRRIYASYSRARVLAYSVTANFLSMLIVLFISAVLAG